MSLLTVRIHDAYEALLVSSAWQHVESAILTFITGFITVYGLFLQGVTSISDLTAPIGIAALGGAVLAGIRGVARLMVGFSANIPDTVQATNTPPAPAPTVSSVDVTPPSTTDSGI